MFQESEKSTLAIEANKAIKLSAGQIFVRNLAFDVTSEV
jgi:hypothetical protein